MQEEFKKIEETVEHLKSYVNIRVKQAKLGAAEKASDVLSVVITKMIVAVIFFCCILFASEALAYFLGTYFNSTWLGFLVVAVLYLIAAMVIRQGREKLIRMPIMNAIIDRLFTNETKQHEEN